MQTREQTVFTVTDLKQFQYCPRIVFYTYCLPLLRPLTFKMEESRTAHAREHERERRRKLVAYGLGEGTRHFDVRVESKELGLRGRIDLVIERQGEATRELIPVDYKRTLRSAGPHWRLQLAAYGMMLEESWGGFVQRGFIYSLLRRHVEEVPITDQLKARVREMVVAMREMVAVEVMPDPPRSPKPCVNCEFRRFCNDVL